MYGPPPALHPQCYGVQPNGSQATHDFEINLTADLEIVALHAKLDNLRAEVSSANGPREPSR